MRELFKKIKTNSLVTAVIYAALGLVLLVWPKFSTDILCTALGLVLVVCGAVDGIIFLVNRDGSLYSSAHLVIGVVLAAVGIWLMARPTLIAVVIPRIIGILIGIHGVSDIADALTLHRGRDRGWVAALALGFVTLAAGAVLVYDPFDAFTTAIRIIGLCLLYDGISDIWIAFRVRKARKQAERDAQAEANAVDAEYPGGGQ
jgi:uncharacterized membrane protein HdeD (DUF308 family)